MLGIILSILGLGGGGIVVLIAKFGFKAVLGTARAYAGKVPPKAWLYIAIAVAFVGALVWHQAHAHSALKKADAAGYTRAMHDVEKRALKLKTKMDGVTAKISQLERKRNDEEAIRIDRSTDNLLRHGPGRAVCPQPAASPGQSQPTAGTGNAALGQLPHGEGIAVIGLPFNDTVRFAGQSDLNRAEVVSWRRWYDALVKAWPKSGPLPN